MINNSDLKNTLRNFAKIYSSKKSGGEEYPILSITKEHGIILQDEKFKKRIASTDTSTYKIVPRGIMVQGIHIDERNFGIQDKCDYGIVSPAYKLWELNKSCNPDVLVYAMRTDETMQYICSKFSGSIKRRESISNSDLLNTPLNLPDINKQNKFALFMKQIDKSKYFGGVCYEIC